MPQDDYLKNEWPVLAFEQFAYSGEVAVYSVFGVNLVR